MCLFRKLTVISFLIGFLFISGCQTVDIHPTETPNLTPVEPATPTLAPTRTKEPTATSSPIVIPSHTPTPTVTVTATLPVFSKEEVEANILQLLMGESNCELPCWWGLMPGKTTWAETKNFLASRGIKTDYYYRDIPWDIYSSANFLESYLSAVLFEFHVQQKIVYGIKFNVNSIILDNDWGKIEDLMKNYAPEIIIRQYGPPTRVWLYFGGTMGEHGEILSSGVDLWLFYDHIGLFVQYMGVTGLMDAENLILCPTFPENQFYAVTFFTSELGDDAELSDFARSENQTPLELEPATGLSVEEFYNLYQQDDEVVCLKSPRELWK